MQFYVTKIKPTISCIRCGMVAEAGPTTIDKWCHSTDELHRIAANMLPDIPVGWSSNGWKGNRRDLRCVSCTNPQTPV